VRTDIDKEWLGSRLIERPRWHVSVERRFCSEHPERPAEDRCDRCGRPFCSACLLNLERWRVCRVCLATLRRERFLQTIPQRLRRGRTELVAAVLIVLLIIGVAGLIQHLLGDAASDDSLAAAAKHVSRAAAVVPNTELGEAPTLRLEGMAVGGTAGGLQVHGSVTGVGFKLGQTVRVVGVWTTPIEGAPASATKLGPLITTAGPDGTFAVHLDFGQDLPRTAGRPILMVTANGDRGSAAAPRRDDVIAGFQDYVRRTASRSSGVIPATP
jgi:hypothetical protein